MVSLLRKNKTENLIVPGIVTPQPEDLPDPLQYLNQATITVVFMCINYSFWCAILMRTAK